jgi:hypothetical protein
MASPDFAGFADRQKPSREEEKVYKDALGRIPNQKPVDPWSRMR